MSAKRIFMWRFSGIYGRENSVKELDNNFDKIAPISLLYDERYNVTNENLQNKISASIRNFYFGYGSINHTEDSRFKVVEVSLNSLIDNYDLYWNIFSLFFLKLQTLIRQIFSYLILQWKISKYIININTK